MVSNLFVKGIAFLTTPIFTRILSRDDIGSYSNLVSWIGILSVIITLDLSASIYLAVFEYKNRLDKYVSSILTLSSITSFLAYLLALIFKDYCLKLFNIEEYMLHVMFFYIIFYPAINMFNIANRTRGKYKSTVIFSLLTCILSNLFAIILVFYYQSGISGRVYGTYLPQICINLVLYFYVLRKGKGF
jgi:O-antigen/teichoic acid export membrane protein